MIGLSVKRDVSSVRAQFASLGRQVDRAVARAMNRAISAARTVAVRQISRDTGIKPQRAVRDRLPLKQANQNRLVAEIGAVAWVPNLARFQARQTRPGVSAAAWAVRKVYRGTFIANKGRTVFKREGKARLPIKPVHGPRLHKAFIAKHVTAAMNEAAGPAFRRTLKHELARRGAVIP